MNSYYKHVAIIWFSDSVFSGGSVFLFVVHISFPTLCASCIPLPCTWVSSVCHLGVSLDPSSNTLATWCKELTNWKRPWCWERLKARGEGDDRGWDGWMASPTQRTWICTNSGRYWSIGKPGVLQFTGSQTVGHDLAIEQQYLLTQFKCVFKISSVLVRF